MNKDKKNKIFLICFVSLLLLCMIYQSVDYYQREKRIEYSAQYRWLSLEEIIDKGMDENNTSHNALLLKNELDHYIDSNGYVVEFFELFPSKYGKEDDLKIS